VRFYSTGASQNVATLLKSLHKSGHGFQFTAADISTEPIFSDH
jgi:hypothetical protein